MLKALLTMLVRSLFEVAVVLLAIAAVVVFLAYRLARRFLTTSDDRLSVLTSRLLLLNSLIPRTATVDQEAPDDDTIA